MTSRWKRLGATSALVLAAVVASGSLGQSSGAQTVPRVVIPSPGADTGPSISDDGGIVVFATSVGGDPAGVAVHDRRESTTVMIDQSAGAKLPSVSGDGCRLAWSEPEPLLLEPGPETLAPVPQEPTWSILIADRCGAGAPVVTVAASDLTGSRPGRPALSRTGDVVVVSATTALLRFDRSESGYTQTVAQPPQSPGDLFGPQVDVSDDGSVVVYSTGTDLSAPTEMAVYRSDAGIVTTVGASAHQPSVSGDGSVVAFTEAGSSTITIRQLGSAPVALETGARPQISGDGNHVVYERAGSIRVTSWTGPGIEAFSATQSFDLTGPVSPTATGPSIDRFGAAVVTDTLSPSDIEVTGIGKVAGFDPTAYEVTVSPTGDPTMVEVRFVNEGPASVGVGDLIATGPVTIGGDGCGLAVRPGSSCTIELQVDADAVDGTVATVSLVPIGIGLDPFVADVRIAVPAPTTTTPRPDSTTTTVAPTTTTAPPRGWPGTGGSTSNGSSGRSSSSSSSSRASSSSSTGSTSASTTSASGVTFSPPSLTLTPTGAETDMSGALDIVNSSPSTVRVVGVRFDPTDAAPFRFVSSTCAAIDLAPGDRCSVTIGYELEPDGLSSVNVVASLDNGVEISATVNSAPVPVPTLAILPDAGTSGQVVTISGNDFGAGTTVELAWADSTRTVTVASDGTFNVPVVVPHAARTGPMTASVTAPPGQADDIVESMLVTSSSSRNRTSLLDGAGPNIGG